jgi:hypothetical protein
VIFSTSASDVCYFWSANYVYSDIFWTGGIYMLNRTDIILQPDKTANRLAARTARVLRRRWLYMIATATALLAGAITVVSAQAATVQTTPAACLSRYVCLVLSPGGTGNVALVAARQGQTFSSPGLPVTELSNKTTTEYCLLERLKSGAIFFSTISAGSTQTVAVSMLDVFPGPICPV